MIAIGLCLAALPLLPQGGAQSGDGRGAWSALEVPGLCVEAAPTPYLPRLVRGQHLIFPGETLEREGPSLRPTLPLRGLVDWLQEEARRVESDLRVLSGGPPILVKGSAAALADATAHVAEIQRASAAFQVELRVWLTNGVATITHPDRAEFEAATRGATPWGVRKVRSGELAIVGSRNTAHFLGTWSAEVASSSGVAEPKLLRALTGKTLHLVAARADGGARVRLVGWLDLAEPGATAVFEPQTPDLGVIQQPTVHAVQVAFGGSVASGNVLAIALDGAPLAQPQCTLWIEARTTPDPDGGPWRSIDTAWLEATDFALPPVLPGAGLDEVVADESSTSGAIEALTASTLAQVFEESRARGAARAAPAVLWAPGYLCVPRGETQANAEIDGLMNAASKDRGQEAEVVVRHGKLRALVPAVSGATVRVLVTSERTVVHGYVVQIATESWMPTPRVERVLDGCWVQGRWSGARLEVAGWSASSEIAGQLSREEARLGRMQLLTRGFRGEHGALDRTAPKLELFPQDGATPGLAVELAQH
ncbi:MAG: hypothetical protein K8S98_12175 [Planctomycetes bacterium]|nr:hypothetical protein [Planctomycetota bacterium]